MPHLTVRMGNQQDINAQESSVCYHKCLHANHEVYIELDHARNLDFLSN
jgi:hypothetical protein